MIEAHGDGGVEGVGGAETVSGQKHTAETLHTLLPQLVQARQFGREFFIYKRCRSSVHAEGVDAAQTGEARMHFRSRATRPCACVRFPGDTPG